MRNLRLKPMIRGLCIAAVLGTCGVASFAQLIPASSADSGRRAVIAVNQGTIYNNINNAQNSANNAWNYANSAQGTANNAYGAAVNAQAGADGAAGTAAEALRRAAEGSAGAMINNPMDVISNQTNYYALEVDGGSALAGDSYNTKFIRVACFRGARGPSELVKDIFWNMVYCPSDSRFVALSFPPGKTPADSGGAD